MLLSVDSLELATVRSALERYAGCCRYKADIMIAGGLRGAEEHDRCEALIGEVRACFDVIERIAVLQENGIRLGP